MTFEVLPTIDVMFDLYEKPRTMERFQEYLNRLQGGTKGELVMPISGFNPMAKEHLLQKLTELRNLKAEEVMQDALNDLNRKFINHELSDHFKVALNLSDDLLGGWTNRYTSDYDSKFRMNALVSRKFCTPIFWTSESFTAALITERTVEHAQRTIYWLKNPKPKTLKEHVEQEKFAAARPGNASGDKKPDMISLQSFYNQNQDSDNYHVIFNFFMVTMLQDLSGFQLLE